MIEQIMGSAPMIAPVVHQIGSEAAVIYNNLPEPVRKRITSIRRARDSFTTPIFGGTFRIHLRDT